MCRCSYTGDGCGWRRDRERCGTGRRGDAANTHPYVHAHTHAHVSHTDDPFPHHPAGARAPHPAPEPGNFNGYVAYACARAGVCVWVCGPPSVKRRGATDATRPRTPLESAVAGGRAGGNVSLSLLLADAATAAAAASVTSVSPNAPTRTRRARRYCKPPTHRSTTTPPKTVLRKTRVNVIYIFGSNDRRTRAVADRDHKYENKTPHARAGHVIHAPSATISTTADRRAFHDTTARTA